MSFDHLTICRALPSNEEQKVLPCEAHRLSQHTAYFQWKQEVHCFQVLFSFHRDLKRAVYNSLLKQSKFYLCTKCYDNIITHLKSSLNGRRVYRKVRICIVPAQSVKRMKYIHHNQGKKLNKILFFTFS